MKKIIACLSLVLAMSVSSAMAATYSGSNNSVDVAEADGYKTVLITNPSGEYVYVDQADSAFTAAANFMLKSNAATAYGEYTITLGGGEGANATYKFTIADPSSVVPENKVFLATPTAKSEADASGNFTYGYKLDNVNLSDYSYFTFTVYNWDTDSIGTGYIEIGGTYDAAANIALTITDVPANVTLKSVGVTATTPGGGN